MKQDARTIRLVFFAAILALLIIPILLYLAIQNFIESYNLVNHTWEVEYKMQRYISGLKFSESAARAYILTGDTAYLADKTKFKAALPQYTHNLKYLISDNPVQVANMNRLESLVQLRLARLDSTLELYRNGMPLPQLRQRMTGGARLMKYAEDLANEMFRVESELLRKREQSRDRYVRFLPICLVALTIILVIVVAFIFLSLQNQLREKALMQQQLEVQNKDLQEQKSSLQRTNEELQSFNYIASHDLKEPLRKILTFGSILGKQEAGNLSEKGVYNLNRLQDAAKRMLLLLEDLLAYTQIKSGKEFYKEVSLQEVMAQVLYNLQEQRTESGINIQVGQLPAVRGIPFQLQQLFENLLHNAIKYRKMDVPAQVTVSARLVPADSIPFQPVAAAPAYHCITISDNGIGFDQANAHKIFDLFTRMHSDRSRTGTGIGLTICKKVVENHQGFIDVKSAVNQGTAFTIYLPAEGKS